MVAQILIKSITLDWEQSKQIPNKIIINKQYAATHINESSQTFYNKALTNRDGD